MDAARYAHFIWRTEGIILKRLRLTTVGVCVTALLGAIATMAIITYAGEKPVTLRVIYTNDMLGYVEPCG